MEQVSACAVDASPTAASMTAAASVARRPDERGMRDSSLRTPYHNEQLWGAQCAGFPHSAPVPPNDHVHSQRQERLSLEPRSPPTHWMRRPDGCVAVTVWPVRMVPHAQTAPLA